MQVRLDELGYHTHTAETNMVGIPEISNEKVDHIVKTMVGENGNESGTSCAECVRANK